MGLASIAMRAGLEDARPQDAARIILFVARELAPAGLRSGSKMSTGQVLASASHSNGSKLPRHKACARPERGGTALGENNKKCTTTI
ncbi:hypothetical protein ASD60_12830 [Pseudomonas sp. Root562]|nr:hypothetical protein ASD60_12830 [Pseudomonas sp. Root562]